MAKPPIRKPKKKVCGFCKDKVAHVDYKDTATLRRFLNDRGRIKARGATGTCSQHQRDVAVAVKTARELVLLPYVVRTLAADKGDRRSGPRRGRPSGPSADSEGTAAAAGAEDATSAPLDGEGQTAESLSEDQQPALQS